jgi:hypothetical protein
MNETNDLTLAETVPLPPPAVVTNGNPPPDAKALRTEHVGKLLGEAYKGASTLKLKPDEIKKLTADFPDDVVEIRPDGLIFVPHMALRDRLSEVFGPLSVAEICRERMIRTDSDEIAVDLVLMIRGVFAAEAIGTAKYYRNNPKTSFGDVVESAWSEALRRCAKKISCGTAVWRPDYVRRWLAQNAVQQNGRWYKKETLPTEDTSRKTRDYTLKEPSAFQKVKERLTAAQESDEPPF